MNMPPRAITVEEIGRTVAEFYQMPFATLFKECRRRGVARPRQVAMALARQFTNYSLPQIGERFGRDHTTVLHGCRRIAALRRDDIELECEMAYFENYFASRTTARGGTRQEAAAQMAAAQFLAGVAALCSEEGRAALAIAAGLVAVGRAIFALRFGAEATAAEFLARIARRLAEAPRGRRALRRADSLHAFGDNP